MVQRLCLVSACLLLAACSGGGASSWVKPIYISKDDRLTAGTAKQILIHNETLESVQK